LTFFVRVPPLAIVKLLATPFDIKVDVFDILYILYINF